MKNYALMPITHRCMNLILKGIKTTNPVSFVGRFLFDFLIFFNRKNLPATETGI